MMACFYSIVKMQAPTLCFGTDALPLTLDTLKMAESTFVTSSAADLLSNEDFIFGGRIEFTSETVPYIAYYYNSATVARLKWIRVYDFISPISLINGNTLKMVYGLVIRNNQIAATFITSIDPYNSPG